MTTVCSLLVSRHLCFFTGDCTALPSLCLSALEENFAAGLPKTSERIAFNLERLLDSLR